MNGKNSDDLPISIGVPQGSILGPLLFLIYINDFPECSKAFQFVMFADDTCLFLSERDPKWLESKLERELPRISDWLVANKLSLNVKKTNFMIFKTKKCKNNKNINVKINGELIPQVDSTKYLGVYIDNKLTFKEHTKYIAHKLSKSNRLLAKLRHFTNHCDILNFYHAHVQSHLNYCAVIWGSAADSYIQRLTALQNKSLCLITFQKSHVVDLEAVYKETKVLQLNKHIFLNQCLFIWKIVHRKFDHNMQSMFDNVLRNPNFDLNFKFILPFRRTSAGQNSLTFAGIKSWNKLPADTKSLTSFSLFKKTAIEFLSHQGPLP